MCVFNYGFVRLKTHSLLSVMFSAKRLSALTSKNGAILAFVCFVICIPRMNIMQLENVGDCS